MGKKRPSQSDFMAEWSKKSGINENLLEQSFISLKEMIIEGVNNSEDHSFYIPKLGTFYKATHKGHPLNLNIENGNTSIPDYETFKFKPSATFKAQVLGYPEEG